MGETLKVVVPNPGSTSLKGKYIVLKYGDSGMLVGYEEQTMHTIEGIPPDAYADGIRELLGGLDDKPDMAAFKAVIALPYIKCHWLDDEVMAAMEKSVPLAPLHNPIFITAINAADDSQ